MNGKDKLLTRSVKVHPVFLVGLALLLVSSGALLGQTLFVGVAAVTGVSVVAGALMWMVLSIITMLLGIWRSFEVIGDAQ